ncbi:MAG TPA: DNA internalization-related competence protein ComEC/Rec2, partial [Pasteurellaceae bacterium]|nr:DNA internalization-related competence protein ComEC/Rec2 [Pasteurellaceae bacterium]
HDDNDHVGGATEIMTQYPALKLMTPSRQNYLTTDRTFCVNGLKQQWQGLRLTVLSPQRTVERAGNKDSCVLLIEDGQYRVLLTGDADIRTENRFAQGLGKIDVLQAGHHGSKTSTGHELVTQIRPTISLISSGRWNRWRFPHQEVIQRLREAQSEIYNTAV